MVAVSAASGLVCGPFEVLLNGHQSGIYVSFALLALFVPLLALGLYIGLMPRFEQNLQKLSEQAGGERRRKFSLHKRIGSWVCRTKEEEVFFQFASIMMARERDFKLKVYPSLGLSIIFPFIFLLMNFKDGASFAEIASGRSYLFIYFCALMIPTVVFMLKYSEKYKAAWIYEAISIKNREDIYKGTLKAVLLRLLLPLFLVEAILFTALFGIRILPELVAVLLGLFLYTCISYLQFGRELPFSEPYETVQDSGRGKMVGLMLLLGGFAAVHFAAVLLDYGVYVYMAVLLVLNFWVWKKSFTTKPNGTAGGLQNR